MAARVFREQRIVTFDPADPAPSSPTCGDDRGYRGNSFISVPICYAAPGTELRCVGVINLTDRIGGDRFTLDDRKLVSAVANQIGAAIENARLVERDLQQQRLQRELELAHDLQLKLLPSPAVLQGEAEVAARCLPADSVGATETARRSLAVHCGRRPAAEFLVLSLQPGCVLRVQEDLLRYPAGLP